MSSFANLIKISFRDFFQRRKKWLIIACVFLGLVISVHFVVNRYVVNVVGDMIKEFVHERSDGFYEVDFKTIAYVLNKGRFIMDDFYFGVNSDIEGTLDYDSLEQRYIYKARIPRLHIDIIEFWSILINRKLRVIGVEVDEPSISVINLNKSKQPSKITFEAGNLYDVLSDHLKELKINNFLIKEGEFDYETYKGPDHDDFKVKGLTFEVKNFQVNEESLNRKDKIFYMDDIFLQVKNQELFLKDSIHKIMFDKFYISTVNNELGFENFQLTRRKNPLIDAARHDHYEISVPDLRLTGIDFVRAYNDNELLIDSFNIVRPVISINDRVKKKAYPSDQDVLVHLPTQYSNYLKINHFLVDAARVNYYEETQEQPSAFSVDNVSAYISSVVMDSAKSSQNKYGFDFDRIDLMVRDYEVALPDSSSTLSFSELSMSSDPLEIILKDLALQPSDTLKPNANGGFAVKLPHLSITGFDIARAISEDSFIVDEVYLQRPMVSLSPPDNKKATSNTAKPQGIEDLYSSIRSFSDLFSIKQFRIDSGSFKYGHPTRSPNLYVDLNTVDLLLRDFYIDKSSDTTGSLPGNASLQFTSSNNSATVDDLNFNLANVSFTLDQSIGHGRLEMKELTLSSDSTAGSNDIDVKFPHMLATGINPGQIFKENQVNLDTLQVDRVAVRFNSRSGATTKAKVTKPPSNNLPLVYIEHLLGSDYQVFFSRDDGPLFVAKDIDIETTGLVIDQSLSDNPSNQFDYKSIDLIAVNNYDLFLAKQDHLLHADQIKWVGATSTLDMQNIFLSPYNKPNNEYRISVPEISMSGIDLKRVLKNSYYVADEIMINNPQVDLKLAKGRQEKLTNLDLGFIPLLLRNRFYGVKTNAFSIQNGRINVRQQQESDSLILELKQLDLLVDNFEVDSTTEMVPGRFLFANDVRLQGDYLSSHFKDRGEFYSVNHLDMSTKEGDIHLNGIYVTTNNENDFTDKGKIRLTTEDLFLRDVDFFGLTQNRELKLHEIHLAGGTFHSTPAYDPSASDASGSGNLADSLLLNNVTRNLQAKELFIQDTEWNPRVDKFEISSDSLIGTVLTKGLTNVQNSTQQARENKTRKLHYGKYLLDTALLKNIEIDRFLLTDTEVHIDNKKEIDRGLVARDVWLLAESIKYDPVSSEDSSRLFYSDNIVARISDLDVVLPDNLNSIRVDEVAFNSVDSTLKATNFALIPLVSRYDFGPAKGYQSTWLKLENDSITLNDIDVLGIFNDGIFRASSLDVHRLDISVFRDKRVPFPEWQRKPLPQANLKTIDFAFSLDTVRLLNGYINYQEHAEKAYIPGEIFFSDLNATIINLTNDSVRILSHPNTRIGAKAKVFGVGAITAEFLFDLVDPQNIHSYGVNVDAFDLTEFNRILIPAASVRVSSGMSEKIIMSARANEDYSFGEMKFYYEDLRIALLDRDTETPKGIGNVLGSFFANTFIIKSNNPRNLFLRKGDIFFERDKKRAIFNYWTKTFLSGVVSSIGATNNKKKIKKMQEENLKKIQEEKSLEAKL